MARVVQPKHLEFILHPIRGDLVVNGVQYSQIYNASTTNTYVSTNSMVFMPFAAPSDPGYSGALREVELGLTAAFQGNATTLCTYKWQGRNYNNDDPVSWVDIKPDEVTAAITTAWLDQTVSGYRTLAANFNSVPFEVRMQFRTNHATMGIGRIKNSTYSKFIYNIA